MESGGRLEHFAARREKMRPDGLLSLKELRHIRSIVQLTERNNSAYVFLGEVLVIGLYRARAPGYRTQTAKNPKPITLALTLNPVSLTLARP